VVSSFNPRAREGRDFLDSAGGIQPGVSIHAPVKDATPENFGEFWFVQFQSTRP